jgi:hypothetical protein
MGGIASILDRAGRRPADDLVLKFLEHFTAIRGAMRSSGVWDESDGLYYDQLHTPDGRVEPVRVRSMVGIIPLFAAVVIDEKLIDRARTLGKGFARLVEEYGGRQALIEQGLLRGEPGQRLLLLGVVGVDHMAKVLTRLFDESEFLSPYGLRALSAYHRDHPHTLELDGISATIDYEPAESTTSMFGGNSNWRGPIWFPLNYLALSCLERYARFFGSELQVEYPTGSGRKHTLTEVASDLRSRLINLFVPGPDGRRPCFGGVERFQQDPNWKDHLLFHEYFHGDNGAGLGASHQTGWTGVIADVIRGRPGDGVYSVGELFRLITPRATTEQGATP